MINLLPWQARQNFSFARRNSRLRTWALRLVAGLIGTVLIVVISDMYMHREINFYKKDIATTQAQLKEQNLDQVQAQAKEISSSIKLSVQVLSKQISFSELIRQIGTVMPKGSALSSLAISKLQGGIDLNAIATDYKTASQIQVNLSDPANKIFSKADIQNITCNKSNDPNYPCQVDIRALFAKNNSFSLIKQEPKP